MAEAVPLGQDPARAQPRARAAAGGAGRRPVGARAGEPGARRMTHVHERPARTRCSKTRTSSATRRAPAAATTRRCKLWLRMLACTTHIEAEIRRRLRERFGISLARFDYMAQLYRYPDGLKMRDAVALPDGHRRQRHRPDRRARDATAWCVRESSPGDRRAWLVRLTRQGPAPASRRMAREHERWMLELFAGLDADDRAAAARAARARCACTWCSNEQRAARGQDAMSDTARPRRESTRPGGRQPPPARRLRGEALRLERRATASATHHAQPARAQEPADLRLLRRAARPVRRAALRRRRARGRAHRRRRQLLLRRRRARDHRPAGAS